MYISLDLETTGFDAKKDQIIEFGAIKFGQEDKSETLQILINPGIQIPQIVTHITKIQDSDVKDAPTFKEKAQEITDFIGDLPIIGHNIQFDTGFLKENGLDLKNLEYDTHDMAGIILPNMGSYSLETLSQHFGLTHDDKHRALDDAIAAMELFNKLKEEFENLDPELLKKIQNLSQKSDWDLKEFLKSLKHSGAPKSQPVKLTTPEQSQNPTAQAILDSTTPTLHIQIPPYNQLAIDLTNQAHPDTYIVVPYQLFRDIEAQIPDTIAKIDLPHHYISLERLKDFESKDHYENHEMIALIKYLVWLPQTETGLLSELRLHQEERNTVHQVNVPAQSDHSKETFYSKASQKDEKAAAICTHEYIIEHPTTNPIVIIDAESFFHTIHREQAIYLRQDIATRPLTHIKRIHPDSKTVAALEDKLTVLFGIIGMIFKKCNDKNAWTPRSNITPDILNSKEWLDAKHTLNNLIELSKEFAELNDTETAPLLQNWKKVLQDLAQIFQNPEPASSLTWIELDYRTEEIVIHKVPININDKLKEILPANYQIIDQVYLPGHIDLQIQSKDSPKNDPQTHPLTVISEDSNPRDNFQILNYLRKFELKGKTVIIFNARKDLEFYTLELSKAKVPLISQLTGSIGKLKELIKETDKAFILITTNTWEKLDIHHEVDTVFIQKLPFDPPSDPFLTALSQNYSDPFEELQIPRAVRRLKKMLSRLREGQSAILLDSRIVTKKYGKAFLEVLPEAEQTTLDSIFKIFKH